MANDILQYFYPEDPTGNAPTNKVTGEFQTINPPDESFDFNWIIPKAGPYFRDTMRLYDVATGQQLHENIDWAPGHKFHSASYETQYVHGGIYASILFLNNRRSGIVEFREYQTLGGNWGLDENKILELLDAKATDPRFVTYEEVSGKPTVFPPIEHNHPADDFTGFRELIAANYDISAAIREATETFLLNPPILMSQYFTKDEIALRELQQREAILAVGDAPVHSMPFPEIVGITSEYRTVPTYPAAGPAGGYVSIPANCILRLCQKISGLSFVRLKSFITSAWSSPSLEINSTYYLRAMVNEIGDLTPYVQKGTDLDGYPGTWTGTPNGSNGGGFSSNPVDILLAKITTTGIGTIPTSISLQNAHVLSAQFDTSGAATVNPGDNTATFIQTFPLNWARPFTAPMVYGTVQQSSATAYVDAGANINRTVSGDRYNITVGISTSWNVVPTSPIGTLSVTLKS